MQNEHWLVKYSREAYKELMEKPEEFPLSNNTEYDVILRAIEHYPHAFVLACCMDRQSKSERVWSIPCIVMKQSGRYSVEELAELPLEWYVETFSSFSLHRYNYKMAQVFHSTVQRLAVQYGGDASRIWSGSPSSATVVYRFLQFDGVGVKIATMAANLLHRCFGVEYSDYSSIDISPDVHVIRIFERAGLVSPDASREEVIYKARELNGAFPGVIDAACWRIGRNHCHATDPACSTCPVSADCPKLVSR